MNDVWIVGAAIHRFGRSDGMTGLDMGVAALRDALADAGVGWADVQFAYGGSDASGNADTMIGRLGLTGIPFINVKNGCATGGSALTAASSAIAAGEYDLGIAVGFDKHPRGAFDPRPAEWGLPDWYGAAGFMLTTQFFAMKLNRYMAEFSISRTTLGRVAEKSFANGSLADHAWRREPVSIDTILNAQMVSDPLTKFMFCSPAEGAVAPPRSGCARWPCAHGRRARSRCSRPASIWSAAVRRRRLRQPMHSAPRRSARRTSTWRSCRIPKWVPKSCTWRKTGSAATVTRKPGWRKAARGWMERCR
jgi:acetyl-CoA acetyltransferase